MEQEERQGVTLRIDKKQVYTMKELQGILMCSKNHIYSMAAKGEIPVIRLGKKIVCPAHRLQQLLDGGWQPPKESKNE